MVNKNVLSCLLKDGKEVNAVMLVGRLFHARATVTCYDDVRHVMTKQLDGCVHTHVLVLRHIVLFKLELVLCFRHYNVYEIYLR